MPEGSHVTLTEAQWYALERGVLRLAVTEQGDVALADRHGHVVVARTPAQAFAALEVTP